MTTINNNIIINGIGNNISNNNDINGNSNNEKVFVIIRNFEFLGAEVVGKFQSIIDATHYIMSDIFSVISSWNFDDEPIHIKNVNDHEYFNPDEMIIIEHNHKNIDLSTKFWISFNHEEWNNIQYDVVLADNTSHYVYEHSYIEGKDTIIGTADSEDAIFKVLENYLNKQYDMNIKNTFKNKLKWRDKWFDIVWEPQAYHDDGTLDTEYCPIWSSLHILKSM